MMDKPSLMTFQPKRFDGSPEQEQFVDEPLSFRVSMVPLNEHTDDEADDWRGQDGDENNEERECEDLEVVNDAVVVGVPHNHEEDGDGEERRDGAAHKEDHRRPAALLGLRRRQQLLLLCLGHRSHPIEFTFFFLYKGREESPA